MNIAVVNQIRWNGKEKWTDPSAGMVISYFFRDATEIICIEYLQKGKQSTLTILRIYCRRLSDLIKKYNGFIWRSQFSNTYVYRDGKN